AKKWDERQKAYDELYDYAQENFTGIRVIKAFVKENKAIHAFAKVAKKNADVNYSFGKVYIFFDLIIELIIYFVIALICGFGGWLVYSTVMQTPMHIFGKDILLSVGQMVEFMEYFDILIWPMIALGQIIAMHSRSKASLKRITIFLDAPESVKSPENATVLQNVQGALEFRHFSFTYPDDTTGEGALKDLTFKINPGERVGVVGKIGSGKSTLANILLRLYNFQEDGVFLDGVDLMKADLTSLRQAIAYAPQDNFLFSDTISNNIAFCDETPDQARVVQAAEFADIDSNIEEFAKKYETVSGERGVTLSGGQKQRISLARAYYKHAPILLMDDTVSAVDVKTEENILRHVMEQRAGMTTIIIASRVSTVRHFDKIVVMVDGAVEAVGNHDELMKSSPSYQKMVYLQQLEAEVQEGGKRHG
ncbi:MAG: ABC transporter ATP-binding protein, partial [Bacilli bacterium]|nr:ABC transporter ATP-binding protein [Bacilli bacterium]